MRLPIFLVPIALMGASACFTSSTSSGTPDGGTTATVTFHKDVEPILQQHCQSCHNDSGGVGPMPLMTYAEAQPYAADMAAQTASLTMPPWGARNTSECTTRSGFKNDPSLTPAQIQTLADWSTQGTVEGNIADAPPPITLPSPGLPNADADLQPAGAFTLPADSSQDAFMCFVLDPKLAADAFIGATAVVPGNSLVVHHALIFVDPTRASTALVTNQAQQSYPCPGGSNVADSTLVAAWAPGGLPHEYPSNIGMPIAANSLLVMQIHYHPHTLNPANQNPDATHFQLRYTTTPLDYYAVNKLVGNASSAAKGLEPGPDDPASGPVFDIPPNVSGHTETMDFPITKSLTQGRPTQLYSVGGHMHLVGNDIKVSITRANGTAQDPSNECLMEIPQWNFYWQRQYDYDLDIAHLPSISAGDKLTVRCTYDNTMNNAAWAEELQTDGYKAPIDVPLGESTTDEMCLAVITVITPTQ